MLKFQRTACIQSAGKHDIKHQLMKQVLNVTLKIQKLHLVLQPISRID